MSNFSRIVKTLVKFWKCHVQDVILWNLCVFFFHNISFYYTVYCKPRTAVSFLIKIRNRHIREISEPREGGGAGYFLVKSSYACQKIRIRPIWAWLSLYWHLRNTIRPYEAQKEKGYFQVKGAVVLVKKLELVVQALFDPLGTPCEPQKGKGYFQVKGGRYVCRKILAYRPEHLSDTKICT